MSKGPQKLSQIWGSQCGPWILAFSCEPIARSDKGLLITGESHPEPWPRVVPRTGSELVWTPFLPETGPGAACLAPSSLSSVFGWCLGLRGREGAGARSGVCLRFLPAAGGSGYSSLIN